jgi:parvulin-like peptidyl-prolyl isomerase
VVQTFVARRNPLWQWFKLTALSEIDRLEAMKTIVIVLAAAVIGGMGVFTGGQSVAGLPPATAPAPAATPDVMATVNGKPISMTDIDEILLYSYGLPVAQQLIANELVRQECKKANFAVTDKDIQREHEKSLIQMWADPTMTAADRNRIFERFLINSKVTRKQWDFTMRRNAQLAKLAEPRIKIEDSDLRQAFNDTYGRKVVVRHIELASLRDAQDVLSRLEKGADFVQLVKEKSIHPATVITPAIKDAALAMTKVGQISPVVQAGEVFHVLKCDQIIEPQNVRFEDVKEKLRQQVHDSRLQGLQQQILMDLIAQARKKGSVTFVNPTLRQLWQEALKEEGGGE